MLENRASIEAFLKRVIYRKNGPLEKKQSSLRRRRPKSVCFGSRKGVFPAAPLSRCATESNAETTAYANVLMRPFNAPIRSTRSRPIDDLLLNAFAHEQLAEMCSEERRPLGWRSRTCRSTSPGTHCSALATFISDNLRQSRTVIPAVSMQMRQPLARRFTLAFENGRSGKPIAEKDAIQNSLEITALVLVGFGDGERVFLFTFAFDSIRLGCHVRNWFVFIIVFYLYFCHFLCLCFLSKIKRFAKFTVCGLDSSLSSKGCVVAFMIVPGSRSAILGSNRNR